MFLMSMASIAFAGTQLQPVSMAVDGAQALAVRGIVAGIELVGSDGDEVRVTGTAGEGTVGPIEA